MFKIPVASTGPQTGSAQSPQGLWGGWSPPSSQTPLQGGTRDPPWSRDPKRPPPGGVGSRPSIFQEKNRGLHIDEKFLVSARIFLLSFFILRKNFSEKFFGAKTFFSLGKKIFFRKKTKKNTKNRKKSIFWGFSKNGPCHEFRVGGAVF